MAVIHERLMWEIWIEDATYLLPGAVALGKWLGANTRQPPRVKHNSSPNPTAGKEEAKAMLFFQPGSAFYIYHVVLKCWKIQSGGRGTALLPAQQVLWFKPGTPSFWGDVPLNLMRLTSVSTQAQNCTVWVFIPFEYVSQLLLLGYGILEGATLLHKIIINN